MVCALLIGREGSSGFPGKNVYPVLGHPLVAYPLMAARAALNADYRPLTIDVFSPRMGL
jgi:CMP-N-acetylneuraminic acid synthetase